MTLKRIDKVSYGRVTHETCNMMITVVMKIKHEKIIKLLPCNIMNLKL